MLVRSIDSLLPRASRNFGGKARNLAALVRAGFPVPAAYAVSCEAAAQTFASCLPEELRPGQIFARPQVAERDLERARALVLRASLSHALAHELSHAFAILQAADVSGVAVRSSSTSEDQNAASAAGLHTSILNVQNERELFDAVRSCYATVFSLRAVNYLKNLGLDAVSEMAIVIQAMVPAEIAGVLFTVNPLTLDEDEMVIDACYGLGTGVTDGRSSPDTYRIEKSSGWVRDRVLGEKRIATRAVPGGGLVEERVPEALAQKQALDEHQLAQLVALGRRVEQHFGDPRDIEFAIAADTLYLLQARPITALGARAGRARTRSKRLGAESSTAVWSNLNVGEALPGVATPLTWSVLSAFSELGFRQAFLALGCKVPKDKRLVGNFRGRIYLNLSELTAIAAQVPGLRPNLVVALGGGSEVELSRLERATERANPGSFLFRLPAVAARFARSNLGFGARVQALEATFEAERARIEGLDLRILAASALDDTLSDVHRLLDEVGTMLLNAYGGLLSVLVPLRAALLLLKREDAGRVQHALISAIDDVESAGPGRETLRVAEAFVHDAEGRARLLAKPPPKSAYDLPQGSARRAVEAFLARYGHRSVREAELIEPRWREDPSLLFDAVRMQLQHGTGDAERRLAARIEAVRRQADEALASIPFPARAPLRALLGSVRNYLRLRERLRSHVVHVLGLFRLIALDASRRLAVREPGLAQDAAFFLTLDELHGLLRGELRSVATLCRMRRAQYDRDRSLPDPPHTFVGFPPSPALQGAGEAERTPDAVLEGMGASSGAAEGVVRVLRSADEVNALSPGEILVVPSADVGWSPLFVVAGALVTDVGGPLSHACVVAREYGLPAVVNVHSATQTLKTGERVRVDGDAGIVRRLGLDSP